MGVMMADPQLVQIVGDGGDGRWWTWRWADPGWLAEVSPSHPQPRGIHEVHDIARLSARLSDALPSQEDDLKLDGPLTSAHGEQALMAALSGALLPPALRAQLIACHEQQVPVHVRVMPSPSAAAVPWGLLPVGGADLRLLDLADVSWIGPILHRDLAPEAEPRQGWRHVQHLQPLRVLDPVTELGAVLSSEVRLCSCHGHARATAPGAEFSWQDLSDKLHEGASRLLLVGHCIAGATRGDTAFMFSAPPNQSLLGRRGPRGALFAADLLRGRSYGGREDSSGQGLWPIPPRAAVVACASGADLADREPLGFATALLINGADTVQATLWMLPTDYALLLADSGAEGAFADLVQAVDHAQACDDPVAAICSWQRSRLNAWRESPSLGTSPILWGSVMTMTAPDRRPS